MFRTCLEFKTRPRWSGFEIAFLDPAVGVQLQVLCARKVLRECGHQHRIIPNILHKNKSHISFRPPPPQSSQSVRQNIPFLGFKRPQFFGSIGFAPFPISAHSHSGFDADSCFHNAHRACDLVLGVLGWFRGLKITSHATRIVKPMHFPAGFKVPLPNRIFDYDNVKRPRNLLVVMPAYIHYNNGWSALLAARHMMKGC